MHLVPIENERISEVALKQVYQGATQKTDQEADKEWNFTRKDPVDIKTTPIH